jgi:hypothetical protein
VTRLLGTACALLVLALAPELASGGGAQARLPAKTLFKRKGADGTKYKLTAGFLREAGEPHLVYSLAYDRVIENPDGSEDSEGGGSQADHLVADRHHLFRLDSFAENDPCRDVAVFGSVAPAVKRVVAVRADGTTRTLRRQHPPPSWHYDGRLIGNYLGSGPVTSRVRVLGSRPPAGLLPHPERVERQLPFGLVTH